MIKVFYGENRTEANRAIVKSLGQNYEIVEGQNLTTADLPSLLKGGSLFSTSRNILIRDLSTNQAVFEQIPNYLDTQHNVIIFEIKLDKRTAAYKNLKDKIEIREFIQPKNPNLDLVFNIYNTAKRDGKKAVEMLEQIKHLEDPLMFTGLLASQAIRDFTRKQGSKEKKALKELSKLDINLKSSKLSSWSLIESFLLRLSSL